MSRANHSLRPKLPAPVKGSGSIKRHDFDALPFGGLWYLNVTDAIDYATHYSRAHDAVINVYDAAGKLIKAHKHKGDFKEP